MKEKNFIGSSYEFEFASMDLILTLQRFQRGYGLAALEDVLNRYNTVYKQISLCYEEV